MSPEPATIISTIVASATVNKVISRAAIKCIITCAAAKDVISTSPFQRSPQAASEINHIVDSVRTRQRDFIQLIGRHRDHGAIVKAEFFYVLRFGFDS